MTGLHPINIVLLHCCTIVYCIVSVVTFTLFNFAICCTMASGETQYVYTAADNNKLTLNLKLFKIKVTEIKGSLQQCHRRMTFAPLKNFSI